MELLTKTKEELVELAKKLKLDYPKNISDGNLRDAIEAEAIRKTVEIEERARLRLQEQSRMKLDIATIQAEASLRGVKIDIPKEPTQADIIRLKKRLDLMINEPKPSPETLAIEASKKVYARFYNMEQENMDIPNFTVGGKYWFHLFPKKVHVLPEWLIGHWRKTARVPIYGKKTVPNPQGVEVGATVEKSGRIGWKQRFLFEILGDAPANASFGVVLDEKRLSKLEPQLV